MILVRMVLTLQFSFPSSLLKLGEKEPFDHLSVSFLIHIATSQVGDVPVKSRKRKCHVSRFKVIEFEEFLTSRNDFVNLSRVDLPNRNASGNPLDMLIEFSPPSRRKLLRITDAHFDQARY